METAGSERQWAVAGAVVELKEKSSILVRSLSSVNYNFFQMVNFTDRAKYLL
jgi:hypothetical protein